MPLGVLDLATGLVLLAAGVLIHRPLPRRLMVASGLAWFLGDVTGWAVFLHRGPLIHLLLSYPGGRSSRRAPYLRYLVAAGYVYAAIYSVAGNDVATAAISITVLLAAVRRFHTARGADRRACTTALVAAAAFTLVLGGSAAARLIGVADGRPVVVAAYGLVVAMVAVAFVADLRWGRWTQATVTRLVLDLGASGEASTLRGRLAQVLADPGLTVGFWVPSMGQFVDEAGEHVDLPADGSGRVATVLEVGDERIGVLVGDASALADRQLVAGVAAAVRLALSNVRLREEIRTRSAEVAASRRRLVDTTDDVRRRLAQELRDGSGQRLDHAARQLRDSSAPGLADSVRDARQALEDLATGIHPAALTAGGLSAALPELARISTIPVKLDVIPGRFPPAYETAAYFVCSEGLANAAKHSGASLVWIRVWADDSLRIQIRDHGVGGARPIDGSGLRGLADRVDALGGRLVVHSPGEGGTRLEAALPLPEAAGHVESVATTHPNAFDGGGHF